MHPLCGACVRRGEDCVYSRDSRFRNGMRRRRRGNRTSEPSPPILDPPSAPRETSHESAANIFHARAFSTPLNDLVFPTTPYLGDASLVDEGDLSDTYPPDFDILPATQYEIVGREATECHENGTHANNNTDEMEMQRHILTDFRNAYSSNSATSPMSTMAPDFSENEIRKARLISNAALRRQQESMVLQRGKSMLNINFDNDSDLALHLLDLHWNTIDLPRLVTYRPAFTDSLINGGPYVNNILLNAIYYSSSLISERDSNHSSSRHQKTAGAIYYSRFCQLLHQNTDQPTLPTAMGLVIAQHRFFLEDLQVRVWSFTAGRAGWLQN